MKPRIYRQVTEYGDIYWFCELPDSAEPKEDASEKEWHTWSCCGVGKTMREAYEDWVKDVESFEEEM